MGESEAVPAPVPPEGVGAPEAAPAAPGGAEPDAAPLPRTVGAVAPDGAPSPYPGWADLSDETRRRWDYSLEAAQALLADDGELGEGPTPTPGSDVTMAAVVIYNSDVPTGDPPEAVKSGHPLALRQAPVGDSAPSSAGDLPSPGSSSGPEDSLQTDASSSDALSPAAGAEAPTVDPTVDPGSTSV